MKGRETVQPCINADGPMPRGYAAKLARVGCFAMFLGNQTRLAGHVIVGRQDAKSVLRKVV